MSSGYRVAMALCCPPFFSFQWLHLTCLFYVLFFFWKHKNTHGTEFATPGENCIDKVPACRNCGAKLGRTETDAAQ